MIEKEKLQSASFCSSFSFRFGFSSTMTVIVHYADKFGSFAILPLNKRFNHHSKHRLFDFSFFHSLSTPIFHSVDSAAISKFRKTKRKKCLLRPDEHASMPISWISSYAMCQSENCFGFNNIMRLCRWHFLKWKCNNFFPSFTIRMHFILFMYI